MTEENKARAYCPVGRQVFGWGFFETFFHLSHVRTREMPLIGKVWKPKSIVCSLQGDKRNRKLAVRATEAKFWKKWFK